MKNSRDMYKNYMKIARIADTSKAETDMRAKDRKKRYLENINSLDYKVRKKMHEIILSCRTRQEAYTKISNWLETEGESLIIEKNGKVGDLVEKYKALARMKANSEKRLMGEEVINCANRNKDRDDEEER